MMPRYTVDVYLPTAVPMATMTVRHPIAWNGEGTPTHFGEDTYPVAECAIHKCKDGNFIHVLRVKSLHIPPIQPMG